MPDPDGDISEMAKIDAAKYSKNTIKRIEPKSDIGHFRTGRTSS